MQYVPPLGATDPNASYVQGNPAAGLRGSFPTAPGFEGTMREVCNSISGAGLTPNPADLTQLLQALSYGGIFIGAFEGTADALTATIPGQLVIPTLKAGMTVIGFVTTTNATKTPTLAVAGFTTGAAPATIAKLSGSSVGIGDVAPSLTSFTFDGARWLIGGIGASSGEGVAISSGIASLAFAGLTEEDTINAADLVAFYASEAEGGQAAGHHYKTTIASLAAALGPLLGATAPSIQLVTASQMTPVPAGAKSVEITAIGGGAGGGGASASAGAGGGAGATSIKSLALAGVASLAITIGAGGTSPNGSPYNSGSGGTTSVSANGNVVASAGGGQGTTSGGASGAIGGPGGTATVGDVLIPGGSGTTVTASANVAGGQGGGSTLGGGGSGSYYIRDGYGNDPGGQEGRAFGSGGGGGSATNGYTAPGGSGAPGAVILKWRY